MLREMGYPEAQIEQKLLKSRFPVLPEELCENKMVDYANEVRKLFMVKTVDTLANTIEVTFSTRSLLRMGGFDYLLSAFGTSRDSTYCLRS